MERRKGICLCGMNVSWPGVLLRISPVLCLLGAELVGAQALFPGQHGTVFTGGSGLLPPFCKGQE